MSNQNFPTEQISDLPQAWRDRVGAVLVPPAMPRPYPKGDRPLKGGSHREIMVSRHSIASRLAAVRAYTLRELNEQLVKNKVTDNASESNDSSHGHKRRVRFRDTNWVAPVGPPPSDPQHTLPQQESGAGKVSDPNIYAQPNDMRGAVEEQCRAGPVGDPIEDSPERLWQSHMNYEPVMQRKMRLVGEAYRKHRMHCAKCMLSNVVDKIIPHEDRDQYSPMDEG